MSFSDVGKGPKRPQKAQLSSQPPTIQESEALSINSSTAGFGQISDGILQYQVSEKYCSVVLYCECYILIHYLSLCLSQCMYVAKLGDFRANCRPSRHKVRRSRLGTAVSSRIHAPCLSVYCKYTFFSQIHTHTITFYIYIYIYIYIFYRYKVQVHVLRQLGDKLNQLLEKQEQLLETLPRSEHAKKRATHIKLARDFRRVETTFKNIQLDTKRKRARLEEQYIQTSSIQQQQQQSSLNDGGGATDTALQQQLEQEDVRVVS